MLCDALIYPPLSRKTEFRHFATVALFWFHHFFRRTTARRPGRRPDATAIDSTLSKIVRYPFTVCKGGVGTIPRGTSGGQQGSRPCVVLYRRSWQTSWARLRSNTA